MKKMSAVSNFAFSANETISSIFIIYNDCKMKIKMTITYQVFVFAKISDIIID